MVDRNEIENRFAYHPATNITGPVHDNIREIFLETAEWVNENGDIPESREKSLALTTIQEAMMWCNAAVAINTKTDSDG